MSIEWLDVEILIDNLTPEPSGVLPWLRRRDLDDGPWDGPLVMRGRQELVADTAVSATRAAKP